MMAWALGPAFSSSCCQKPNWSTIALAGTTSASSWALRTRVVSKLPAAFGSVTAPRTTSSGFAFAISAALSMTLGLPGSNSRNRIDRLAWAMRPNT